MGTDFLIIGGGIIGLTTAHTLKTKHPDASITIIEKEPDVGFHASGRNSGVLHAGFYYSADSLKAKFCREGNIAMRAYCQEHGIKFNPCQKLVVAGNDEEVEGLRELKRRGDINHVPVELIDEKQAAEIEPHARTHEYALLSPTTATVNPLEICRHLRGLLAKMGVQIVMNCPYQQRLDGNRIMAAGNMYEAQNIINCAGLYAVDIAQDFGFARDYTIMPFKGVYLKYTGTDKPLRTLIYGVPDMRKPFLGVQFSLSADNDIRIGPTAIPAFWRENYGGLSGFNAKEMTHILFWQANLFIRNSFGFRTFALEEMRKYSKSYLLRHAFRMVKNLDARKFNEWSRPGIRAQLLNTKTLSLVQDFAVEGDDKSLHVLNAVSPAFTSSFAFAKWLTERWN
jgi:L-2-hydroxyglutarate oxidase LhgO